MTKRINGHIADSTVTANFNFMKNLAVSNLDFFKNDKNEMSPKFVEQFTLILDVIDPLLDLVEKVSERVNDYNFSENCHGNGHDSWVKNTHKIVKKCTKCLEEVTSSRGSYFFRREYYLKEVAANAEALESMFVIMNYLLLLMAWCEPGELFTKGKHSSAELLTSQEKNFSQYCFYGRCIGFQFCDSMASILKALCILMASFSEVYYSNGRILDPIVRGSKYWVDPELRAKRIVNVSQYGSADFCKNFWYLGDMELMTRLPSIVMPTLIVNKLITIEPKPLVIKNIHGKEVDIPLPSSHIGPGVINVRLLSSSLRLGMEEEKLSSKSSGCYKFPSESLLFHCHGGGFVAQSSKSHENYLRQWAIGLDVPILSVDYSLAPEAPYPRALEEVFYCYCWVLTNSHCLGSTAQNIVLAGDSAGANLNIALTMMCLEYGIRPPTGLFLAYVPILLDLTPSPSRLLCFMDPLLPFGFILGCSKAYACSPEVYRQSMSHERKLRRNISRSEDTKIENNVNAGNCSADNAAERPDSAADEQEEAKPALMTRSSSTGIISRWVESLSSKISSLSPSRSFNDEEELEQEMLAERLLPCPLEMLNVDVPKDPYISPFYAADSVLSNFPPVSILTTDQDPFIDDGVEFAKRLKSLGVRSKLDILSGLCHGFLNFSLLCNEAYEGSKTCIERIKELFQLGDEENLVPAEEC